MRLPRLLTAWQAHWVRLWQTVCGGLLLTLAVSLSVTLALAQQAVPALTGHVLDTSATLGTAEKDRLEGRLADFERARGAQIVVLLVPTTQPEDIVSYANRVGDSWKIGRKGIGDGLLLIVARNDRKVRIEVTKALEGAIPDLAAKQIIEETITPHFRQGDFAGGLEAATERIMTLISGEALPVPTSGSILKGVRAGFDWIDLAIFAFFAVPVVSAVARRLIGPRLGALVTGAAVGSIALFITSSLVIAFLAGALALLFTLFSTAARGASGNVWSAAHHGGWSGGGGGFSSGGGGDFGGGGASGDW